MPLFCFNTPFSATQLGSVGQSLTLDPRTGFLTDFFCGVLSSDNGDIPVQARLKFANCGTRKLFKKKRIIPNTKHLCLLGGGGFK